MSDAPKVYDTLEELMLHASESLGPNSRPYRVGDKYVVSNSPGNAAVAVVEVERCSQKDAMTAMVAALKRKGGRSPT